MSASGEPELGRLSVSIDVAFQVEAEMARNELLARLGFNRTLLTLQIQVLGTAVAVLGVITQGKYQLPPTYIETVCGTVLWISYALQSENIVNQSSISALARFLRSVLNKKYGIRSAPQSRIWDWDHFLARQHPASPFLKRLSLSVLSPSFILNLLMSGGSIAVFWIASRGHLRQVGHFALAIVVSGLVVNCLAIFRYLRSEDFFVVKWRF